MGAELSVRRAGSGDVDAILVLWDAMWREDEARDERFRRTAAAPVVARAWIEGRMADEHSAVFVADRGGRVVGYAVAIEMENLPMVPDPRFGALSEIAVDPSERRRGAGTALLESVHDWCRGRGLEHVELSVSVRNAEALEFYAGKGYAPFLERLRVEL